MDRELISEVYNELLPIMAKLRKYLDDHPVPNVLTIKKQYPRDPEPPKDPNDDSNWSGN